MLTYKVKDLTSKSAVNIVKYDGFDEFVKPSNHFNKQFCTRIYVICNDNIRLALGYFIL